MHVTLDVAGGDTHECEAGAGATWADLLAEAGLSPHEASVLVEGRPVPLDQTPAEGTERVEVLRLVRGG
jgi:sulfur carrier protein